MGEAPSKSGDRFHMVPLSGAVAETLCKLAGIPPQAGGTRYGQWTWALYEHFECRNLIKRWPGAQGRGSAFPMEVARPLAYAKAAELQDRVVVLLGARLTSLFGQEGFYEWCDSVSAWKAMDSTFEFDGEQVPNQAVVNSPCQVVAIPHPSGLNRMLNDPSERERCGFVLREAMERAAALEPKIA